MLSKLYESPLWFSRGAIPINPIIFQQSPVNGEKKDGGKKGRGRRRKDGRTKYTCSKSLCHGKDLRGTIQVLTPKIEIPQNKLRATHDEVVYKSSFQSGISKILSIRYVLEYSTSLHPIPRQCTYCICKSLCVYPLLVWLSTVRTAHPTPTLYSLLLHARSNALIVH